MAKFITATLVAFLLLMGGVSIFLPFILEPMSVGPIDIAWYFLSFFIGLSMIILPSALPAALVVVPIATKDGMLRGVSAVLSFGLGIMVTLSFYGVLISLVGRIGLSFLHLRTEDILYWMYFFSGIFVYILALSEIGVLRSVFRPYAGVVREDVLRVRPLLELFFLGIFLGNIGVGGIHSGVPLLLLDASAHGNVFHGWSLFFVNAIGRIFPLLFLVVLSVRGIPALEWLVSRREVIRRSSGWFMLVIAVFFTTLGFFGYDWLWGNLSETTIVPLPYVLLGNTFLLLLLLLPLWLSYLGEHRRASLDLRRRTKNIMSRINTLNEERSGVHSVLGMTPHVAKKYLHHIDHEALRLEKERRIVSSMMYRMAAHRPHDVQAEEGKTNSSNKKRNLMILLSCLLVVLLLLIPCEVALSHAITSNDVWVSSW